MWLLGRELIGGVSNGHSLSSLAHDQRQRLESGYKHGHLTFPEEARSWSVRHGLAIPDRVFGVVLLCAHPRNALYVVKWTFMCPLRGSKMGRLEAALGQFRRCWGHEVPCWRCFGQGEGLEMLDMGCPCQGLLLVLP